MKNVKFGTKNNKISLEISLFLDYNIIMKKIVTYKTIDGKCPFDIWFSKLDKNFQVRIYKRLERLEEGNFGDFKKINSDISELRLMFGSGYRIYYTEHENIIVILLCGGDKSTQSKDIEIAKKYLLDLQERSF